MLFLYLSLSANEILKKIDDNLIFNTIKSLAKMTIEIGETKIVKEFILYGKKQGDKFFIEFINPEDKGVKYLKIKNELWIYFPDADDIMKISGHMLRQGMMGSDLSYEDLLSDEELRSKYESTILGDTIYESDKCYILQLTAINEDVTYYSERLIVSKEKFIPLEIELLTKSGRIIKKIKEDGIMNFNGRYFPTIIKITDLRKKNSVTTIEYKEIYFDIHIKDEIFTKQNLKR